MTDESCKQIMEQLGMPNSRSLMTAIFQVANETEQEVREKITADNSVSTQCPHFSMGTDGAHRVLCSRCFHPNRDEWSKRA